MPAEDTNTIPEPTSLERARRARLGRRIFLAALGVFLLLGALNVFGVKSSEKTATGGGYSLTVKYAKTARPGLAVPWSFTVSRDSNFAEGDTVRIRTESEYFNLFDENGFSPQPTSELADGRYTYWEFEVAPGSGELNVSLDARIEPGAQNGKTGSVAVVSEDGSPAVEVAFTTRVWP